MARPCLRLGPVLLLAVLLLACDRGPRLPLLAHDARVLAFGDSLTHGAGAKAEDSYPTVLSELIGREVVNAGVPGELSAEGLRRLPDLLDEVAPSLLLICHGGNDILRGRDLAAAQRNIAVELASFAEI